MKWGAKSLNAESTIIRIETHLPLFLTIFFCFRLNAESTIIRIETVILSGMVFLQDSLNAESTIIRIETIVLNLNIPL
jgi:hypothetical protein